MINKQKSTNKDFQKTARKAAIIKNERYYYSL